MTPGPQIHHAMGMTQYDQEAEHHAQKQKGHHLLAPPEMDEQVRRFIEEEDRTMSEFLREAIRLYMHEQEWLRRQRRQRAEARRKDKE